MKKITPLFCLLTIGLFVRGQKSDNETVSTTFIAKPNANNGSINSFALFIDRCENSPVFVPDSFYFASGQKTTNFGDDKKWFSNKDYKRDQNSPDLRIQFTIGKVNVTKKDLKDNGEIADVKLGAQSAKIRHYTYNITADINAWFIVMDKNMNVVQAQDLSGTYNYEWTGDRKNGTTMAFGKEALEQIYASPRGQILNVSYAISAVLVKGIEMAQQAVYYKAEDVKASVACGIGDRDYTKLKAAQTTAIEGYKLYDKLQDGSAKLKEAIPVWVEELKTYEPENKDARINKKIAVDLYQNLAYAYIFTGNIAEAKKALASATEINQKLLSGDGFIKKLSELIAIAEKNEKSPAPNFSGDKKKGYWIVENEAKHAEKFPAQHFRNSPSCDQNFKKASDWTGNAKTNSVQNTEVVSNNNSSNSGSNSSNPYASKMVKTAAQGNVLTLTFGNYPTLPVEVCQLTDLNELQANMAKIQTVPAEIGNLINLKHLNLANNPLKSLPPEIAKLTKLETLNLKRTDFTEEDIKKIQALLPNCKVKF